MKEITSEELKAWQDNKDAFQLIDIREGYELEEGHINGQHIPMEEVASRANELSRDVPVVIHCRSGKRAEAVISMLERRFAFQNLYCLQGGIMAYADTIDPSLQIS